MFYESFCCHQLFNATLIKDSSNGKWHWIRSTNCMTKSGQPRKLELKLIPDELKRLKI